METRIPEIVFHQKQTTRPNLYLASENKPCRYKGSLGFGWQKQTGFNKITLVYLREFSSQQTHVPRLLCLNLRAIRKVSVAAGTETNKLTPSAWNVVSPTCLANGVFSLPDACLFSQPKPLMWQSDKFFTPFSTFWTNPPYHIPGQKI